MPCSTLRVHSLAAILVGIAVAAVSREVLAGDTYSAELGIGGEYDSNIAVEELDASTSQSDYALTLTAGVGMQQKLSDIVEFGLTYDYDQRPVSACSRSYPTLSSSD
jgi:opacity protein-like surface antigen